MESNRKASQFKRKRHSTDTMLSCNTVCIVAGCCCRVLLQWADNNLWPEDPNASPAATGARLAVMLILETGAMLS
jgi:hypothetical protein